MIRLIFYIVVMLCSGLNLSAQDSIVFKSQPPWNAGRDITSHCLFYEETTDKPLSFEEVQQQVFVPFNMRLASHPTNRPLLIQWYQFSISNQSATDTIHLRINTSAHYFTRLYASEGLIAKSGIYETSVPSPDKSHVPISVAPSVTKTYWLRTEDRQGHMVPPAISIEPHFTYMNALAAGQHMNRLVFLFLALLTGCLLFITLFAVYQYYLYRDKVFLWYIAYTFAAVMTGFFWMDIRLGLDIFSSFFHDLIFSIFLFLIPVLYSLFIGTILKLQDQFKKAWVIVKVLMLVAIAQMLISFITMRTGNFLLTDYYGYFVSVIPVAVLNMVLLFLTAYSKEKVKWFMFAGLLSMLLLWCLPLLIFSAINIQWKWNAMTAVLIFIPFYSLLGLTIEAICFSFALSYRSKLVLMEKNRLQQQYNLQLQDELVKRTAELEEQNKLVEEQKLQQVQSAFEQKIAETEMTALRAQMNPHFIFNCLNSIKLYTLENNSTAAAEYLTKFSQLIRLVLENSRTEKITLQKELETLQLYIDLEAMRFKEKVKYQINVSPGIDQQYTELPPLLIQPYVENAIWHGLMQKKEGGDIVVDITQPTESSLLVEITDDGVGREQAALYKSKSATKQKSFGLKMTSERIEMINHVYDINATVNVVDLKDGFNNACGTKVIIKIPV
ncbi:MAG: histidine kinase [Bacteroidota bacterium]